MDITMGCWDDLGVIAGAVWEAYQRLLHGERGEPVAGMYWTRGLLPPELPLREGGKVVFHDQCVPTWLEGQGETTQVEYQAVGEIRPLTGARLFSFHFTTTSERARSGAPPPLEDRVAAQVELRRLAHKLRAGERQLKAARTTDEWREVTERFKADARRYGELLGLLWLHQRRTSPGVKQRQWAHRSGQSGLPAHGLGPILLSRRTTPEEIRLKMALLSARAGLLRGQKDYEHVIQALEAFLHLKPNSDHEAAREVFGAAVFSGARQLGYIGDLTPATFRSYLGKVLRSQQRRPKGEILGFDERWATRYQRIRAGVVRLPGEDETPRHPWREGRPALLARLADEYEVDLHVVHGWVRAGRLEARQCRVRTEVTAQGIRVAGKIEVPASARPAWEGLCVRYLDMRARKAKMRGGTAAEKKRWARAATKRGGSRERAASVVAEQAQRAGLSRTPLVPA